nr:MAG TPA: hypothetical protein [Caudoviricetes sp.]
MKKCECYHTRERTVYDPYTQSLKFAEIEGECWGTNERDICSCKGDECQCDFYPHIKQKALKEKQSKRGKVDIVRTLQHYLDFNEEDGVVCIPKVTIEKIIKELKEQ